MKTLTKTILAVLATGLISCALFSQQAQADPIVGSITFGGAVTFDTGSVDTATQITAWHGFNGTGNPVVVDADGSYAAFVTPGTTTATFAGAWLFNTVVPIVNFWSAGGFTFELTASHIFSQGNGGLMVNGYGWVTGHGFDRTYGTWSFSTQSPAAGQPPRFSFSAADASVPDSGSTVAFLGLALIGVEALRRRMRT